MRSRDLATALRKLAAALDLQSGDVGVMTWELGPDAWVITGTSSARRAKRYRDGKRDGKRDGPVTQASREALQNRDENVAKSVTSSASSARLLSSSSDPDSDSSPGILSASSESVRERARSKTGADDPVFRHWADHLWSKIHPGRAPKASPKRLAPIRARRRDGYTDEQLCAVIDRVGRSRFHLGENDAGKPYIEPETIFRNAEKVDAWLAAQDVATAKPVNGAPQRAANMTDRTLERVRMLEEQEARDAEIASG